MPEVDWDARYRDGEIPWEKGMPHPGLLFFVERHREIFADAPRLFHAGCGYGRDASYLALFCSELTALDISEAPIDGAKKLYPEIKNINWHTADLFTWDEPEKYDLVWEQSCFCAIPLERRQDYVRSVHALLKPGGLLVAVFFLNPDHPPEEGPPFGVTREELNDFFAENFELLEDSPNPPTYEGRENRETIMVWRKRP